MQPVFVPLPYSFLRVLNGKMAEQCHGCIVAGAVLQFVCLTLSAALLTNLRRGLECL